LFSEVSNLATGEGYCDFHADLTPKLLKSFREEGVEVRERFEPAAISESYETSGSETVSYPQGVVFL
jgi:hypothetical protein